MKRLVLVLALAASLSGCATVGALNIAADKLCDRQDSIRIALNLALTQTFTISDQTRRNLMETGIRASLAAIDACPIQQGAI